MSAVASFTSVVAYFIGPLALLIFLYSYSSHPLNKFPGPAVARVTDGYAGFHAARKRLHLATYQDHVKYGPVVRQGPDRLVFNTVTALHDIYLNQRVTKSKIYLQSLLSTPTPSMFNALDRAVHSHKRRVANSYRINLYMTWPATRLLDPAVRWLGRKRSPKFFNVLRTMIGRRMSLSKDAAHDLYAVASGDVTPSGDTGLQATELWSEASFFVMAGGTTVATLMSAVFFCLSRHPAAYARLAAEVRAVFPSGRAIAGGPQLGACRYLRAVIDETMRVAPPTTATPWREDDIYSAAPPAAVADAQPFVVDGHVVPRGTAVGVSLYSLMHNEAYFPEPFAFRPERWLDDEKDGGFDEETRATMRRAFAPFALGDRGCAGKAMAYLETSLVIAKTLWYFDFETAPGPAGKVGGGTPGSTDGRHRPDEYQLYDIFTADHDGPNLVFKPRAGFVDELGSSA
ncbi:cytochrome P450 [Xylariomycetidae sp. FL0641]|nr:cytochrome P450 [Xylariomycetidae sp. FL0641]